MPAAPLTTVLLLDLLRRWGTKAAGVLLAEETRQAALPPDVEHPSRWHVLEQADAKRLRNIVELLAIDSDERDTMLRATLRLAAEPWRNFGPLSAFDVVAQTVRFMASEGALTQ